ncbi:MAG: aldehyde dehydrogenase family protein [Sediminibacterium sp.]|jgi:aldehyde dehydrogenase (NAD+)|nr:aldehyde dehydrogenase family protein [Sediminibacterium sp.]
MTANINALKDYFSTGATQNYAFRLLQLERLKKAVLDSEKILYEALYADLKKTDEDAWATEVGFFLSELNYTIKHLQEWMQPKSVATNLVNMPSTSYTIQEPLGVVCIIAPWNYPFQLLFTPLIGAIAGGNCAVLKPSEFAPATAKVMAKIIADLFPNNYMLYLEGDGATVLPPLLTENRFDHIFYTGSTAVGKIIYKYAAEKLVPVTLELGGKSPAVITADANLRVAARRLASPKFSNCGQMCIAPDYILVPTDLKDKLIKELIIAIQSFYGVDAEASEHYGKIINDKQWLRITSYLSEGEIVYGGKSNREKLFIEPTIMTGVHADAKIMQDEIFGPILPILTYSSKEEALAIVQKNPNPIAFYVFTENKTDEQYWLTNVPSGGACVNNATMHITNHDLPFGGRGNSGTGGYHGKLSFDTFTHTKSVLKTPTWIDPGFKYPPYKGKDWLLKRLIG